MYSWSMCSDYENRIRIDHYYTRSYQLATTLLKTRDETSRYYDKKLLIIIPPSPLGVIEILFLLIVPFMNGIS